MTTMQPRRKAAVRRARHVHLGDRLLAIGRVRSGVATVDEVAADNGVARDEVLDWITQHAGERTVTLTELRAQGSPQMLRLAQRAQRLAELVAEAERSLRRLNQELVRGLAPSNEPFETSNNLDEKPHRRERAVAGTQPSRARTRKFVDGASSR
jgi:hypothetical protein